MQLICLYILFGLIMNVPISGQSCSCSCGTYRYYLAVNCSSADSCATICNSNYATCTNSNTYGCCGSSCIYYSSIIRCQCACSSSYSGTVRLVGSIRMHLCTLSACKSACSSAYWTTCGRRSNKAYCGHAMSQHQAISMVTIVFNLGILYFGGKYF